MKPLFDRNLHALARYLSRRADHIEGFTFVDPRDQVLMDRGAILAWRQRGARLAAPRRFPAPLRVFAVNAGDLI